MGPSKFLTLAQLTIHKRPPWRGMSLCVQDFAEVSMEFLGLEEDVENTTYTVVSSTNGFATESVVGEYADNVFPGLDNGDTGFT